MTKSGSTITKSGSPSTLDEARLLANVNERAQRLFEDGYRIRSLDAKCYLVRSPQGVTYTLDRLENACSCPFFEKHGGRYPCKHTLGWRKLLLTQRAAIQALTQKWESIPLREGITQIQQGVTQAILEQLQKQEGQPPCL